MSDSVREFFETLESRLDVAKLDGQTLSFRFDIDGAGSWNVSSADGQFAVVEGTDDAETVFSMKEETFLRLLRGEQKPTSAFMTGKLRIQGDMGSALKLKDLFF
jgi:putative sterol carrier protein